MRYSYYEPQHRHNKNQMYTKKGRAQKPKRQSRVLEIREGIIRCEYGHGYADAQLEDPNSPFQAQDQSEQFQQV